MREGDELMHRAEEAAYRMVVAIVRSFRDAGWDEDRIEHTIGGAYFDEYRHSTHPIAYDHGLDLLLRALEETRP